MTADKPPKLTPAPEQKVPLSKPAEPKTIGEAVADHVDELLRSIRSD